MLHPYFEKRASEARKEAAYRPDSTIPESDHSPKQRAIDESRIRALATTGLVIRSPQTGEARFADSYWAPSRTGIEVTVGEEGQPDRYEIVGGEVTRAQALLELNAPVETLPMADVIDMPVRRVA